MNQILVFPSRFRAQLGRGLWVLTIFALGACQLTETALEGTSSPDASVHDTALFAPEAANVYPDVGTFETQPIASLAGPPQVAGCADGTREGFLSADFAVWPNIAGCSGAWDQPGLTIEASRQPSCGRLAGNTGIQAAGIGCGAADLCANAWHVCRGPIEVERLSPSQCESVVAPGVAAFFAVAGGGGAAGDCAAGQFGPKWLNDIRGCGTIGHAEGNGCYPLDRRLEFSDCLATKGAWACGGPASHDQEVKLVVKPNTDQGGVLCCRDES